MLVLVAIAVLAGRASAAPCDGDTCEEIPRDETDAPDAEVIPRVMEGAVQPCAACSPPIEVSAVANAAVRAAGLADDPISGWRYRARLAGLIPIVSGRFGHNLSWKEVDDPTLANTNMYDVRATFQLERLVFDPNEVRIEAMDVSRRREKRKVAELAIHSYYAWLTAQQFAKRSVTWQMRSDELTADLDALTDEWFSQTLKRRKP